VQQRIEVKLIVIICIFLVTIGLVYSYSKPAETIIKPSLVNHFGHVDGYRIVQKLALDEKAVGMLELDDYIYANYQRVNSIINLYIGYYFTADKAYSAHSPLICYPSQGWEIVQGPSPLEIKVSPYPIHCDLIVTSYGDKSEIVLYWYQAGQYTNTKVYQNKIDLGYNKLLKNDEQHGFIRISVPIQGTSLETARNNAIDFIRAFYPTFIEYIQSKG
jgi:EpsI family protein